MHFVGESTPKNIRRRFLNRLSEIRGDTQAGKDIVGIAVTSDGWSVCFRGSVDTTTQKQRQKNEWTQSR